MSPIDVLLVNPPAPDGGIWIRSQHRVGRRSREGMIWAQVSLAQMAALLIPSGYSVQIVDAIAERMGWTRFEALLRGSRPRYYVTQVTAPTLQNDLYGTFLARSLGARTVAFGTHVTPLARETMVPYPSLDFVLRGEPELTLLELLGTLEGRGVTPWQGLFEDTDPAWREGTGPGDLGHIQGLAWRRGDEVVVNPDRPFIRDLDRLPLPRHDLLPLDRYRMPMIRGPYSFVVTSRGCPAACGFCIKHTTYGRTVRVRSPEHVLAELRLLRGLGLRHVHMYADLFTVDREQVVGICERMLQERLDLRWTCNSRVDFVDEALLQLMARAGCWMISWGIESASEEILRRVHKGYHPERAAQALGWARAAGIRNWGYFIIGLPGETDETVRQTIAWAKKLPLDLALFHIAAPYPGTPFYREALAEGWLRPGVRWEDVDMDRSTVLDYPQMPAERIEYWAQRAFREWAFRPGPMWTYLTGMLSPATFRSAVRIGLESLGWAR